MNAPLFLLIFAIVATVLLACLGAGFLYLQKGRKRQIQERLGSATELSAAEAYTVTILNQDRGASWTNRMRTAVISQVDSAGLKWSVSKVLATCLGFALLGAIAGVRISHALPRSAVALALFVPVAFSGVPFLFLARMRTKRLNRIEAQLPDAFDFLARSLRIGNSFLMSLEMLVEESEEPLRGEFRRLTGEIRLGSPIAEPLQKLMQRVPLLDLRMFVSAVLLQRETGGNLGVLLSRIAVSIRDRFRVRGQVDAAAAQAKLSAQVLSMMPVVVLGGILTLSPNYLRTMTDEPIGRKLLAAAAFGQLAGFFIMRKIVWIKV